MAEASHSYRRSSVVADRSFTFLAWLAGMAGILLPVSIITYLVINGAGVVDWKFLTEGPRGLPLGGAGGIRPALEGSLALIAVGLSLALPLGVGSAIFLTEYARSHALLQPVRFAAECLAAVPSIVYGLFGYAFLVVFMALNVSLLAGGLTLGFVMFPLILIGTQESLEAVDWRYREAALALGVTRSYMVRRIILPKAWPGIVSITVLAAGHAFGSAAPVLYTASVIFSRSGLDLASPVMTLPTHLYYLVSEAVSFDHAYGTALVLVVVLLAANFLAMYAKRLGRAEPRL